MYNLHVEGTARYLVGACGVVVHNSPCSDAAEGGVERVQRMMSRAELEATQATGLVRGGKEGTHYVTPAASSDALRARQRLALPQTPEIRATLEVPSGAFSPATRVDPRFNMPGGGLERKGTGRVPARVIDWEVLD